ncbi:MAG: UDP-N-acetylglucosamine--N-acetylmuramyl-(pentapeptide) pyrophosphoryl-undecaprenol N-acetylglucosamine transferase [Candidatus Berkelbacteria bacterium]|nr:UDP-N-acetylglucosamine--N-acetylmuramyl-(pentapeptide) pyrophosphoryl-undecaprenol N-acetylglucosamine transferase [Candidatus Berkelbacteria bacterium]
MKKYEKVLLVGGGTGGHAAPILAVYQRLRQADPSLKLIVVGSGGEIEAPFYSNLPDYRVIRSGKLNRYFTFKNISEFCNLSIGVIQSIQMLRREKPRMIFAKGGHVSLPIVLSANYLKIPYFIHESDIEMGKANKTMSRDASRVFVGYPAKYYPEIDQEKLVWSGPLLRENYENKVSVSPSYFGFKTDKPCILITGGSQGSLHLSEVFVGSAKDLLKKYNIIHQAGKHSIDLAREFEKSLSEEEKGSYYLCDFLSVNKDRDMMALAMNLADLVITRAGSTIMELAILGKAMILVPWKHSAQNHQTLNADYLTSNGGAVSIDDDELNSESLSKIIEEMFAHDRLKLKEVSTKAKQLFPHDGTKIVCDEILKEIK